MKYFHVVLLYVMGFAAMALSQDSGPTENAFHFRTEYHHQTYFIDAAKKRFESQQIITIRNTSAEDANLVCFLMHPILTINHLSLTDSLEKEIPVRSWAYNGTVKIYGRYDYPVVAVQTSEPVKPDQMIFFHIDYTMKPEAVKPEPEQMYEFTVSPFASYAISPLIGNCPFFMQNDATPYTMIIKYPSGNLTCVPGELVSREVEGKYIIDTYEHRRPNVPTFALAPYQEIVRESDPLKVTYYLYPHEQFVDTMADEMFAVVQLYFKTFGDNETYAYKFATVGEKHSQRMNGENKGSTIFYPDFVSRRYTSGTEGKYAFLKFLSHEVFHNWNLFYVYWRDNYREWFGEGGANFVCAWATEKILGKDAGTYVRHQFVRRFIDQKGYESPRTLRDVTKTGTPERALMYAYGALVWEQLERKIGEEALFSGLGHFFRQHGFQSVGYSDLLESLGRFSNIDIASFLKPWFSKNARIDLSIEQVNVREKQQEWITSVDINVNKNSDNEILTSLGYRTKSNGEMTLIPIHITNQDHVQLEFSSREKPIFIQIDPEYIVPVLRLDNHTWEE